MLYLYLQRVPKPLGTTVLKLRQQERKAFLPERTNRRHKEAAKKAEEGPPEYTWAGRI